MLRLSQSLSQFGGRFLPGVNSLLASVFAFLIRYRIRLSMLLFAVLVLRDMLAGFKPHDVTNVGDLLSLAGVGLLLGGLFVRSWAAGILHKLDEVTTTGPYKLIRHPLYIGS